MNPQCTPREEGWGGDATSVIEFLRPLRSCLDSAEVLEVCVNRPGEAFVETQQSWQRRELPDLTLERCLALATAMATYTDQQIHPERPLLSATLPSGERIQFAIAPAVSRGTVAICIRKPSTLIRPLAQLHSEGLFSQLRSTASGTVPVRQPQEGVLSTLLRSGRHAEFLSHAVRLRKTIVVSGKTGSGKTTLMKALIEEIPAAERLITIEDAAELILPKHPNSVHLFYSRDGQGTARISAKSLLEACLRMRPDRILLAEVRGEECFHFLRLAASGHPGSVTSVHAGSCALALEQMALMIRESSAGVGLSMSDIRRLLCTVIHIIVQVHRDERGRFVSEICHLPALEAAAPGMPIEYADLLTQERAA